MEGLEISEVTLNEARLSTRDLRIDAQFFSKTSVTANAKITKKPFLPLGAITSRIQSFGAYSLTNEITYLDTGVPFLRCVNIGDGFVTFADALYVSKASNELLYKSEVKPSMVLITMSGSVGRTAVADPKWHYPINSNQDIAKITLKKERNCYFVSAFLNSAVGRAVVNRFPVGSVQQHIFLWQLEELPIPQFSDDLTARIGNLVRDSYEDERNSNSLLDSARKYLASKLMLTPDGQDEARSYVRMATTVFSFSRLDAEFFHPRVDELLKKLGDRTQSISDVATLRQERFSPSNPKFNYLEIGAVSADGTVQDSIIDGVDAPSRATWIVHKNDIVTSTVRPIRSLTAMIDEHQENAVASSGFAVLQPAHISPELLLCYLKLPQICELMDLHTSASMYPAISVSDILNLPFKHPGKEAEDEIISLVQQARSKRRQSKSLLERAKRAVEIAIEHDEATALAYLDGKHYIAEELLPKLFHLNRHYVDLDAIQRTIEAESIHYEPTTISRYLLDWQAESRLFDAGRGWYSDLTHRYGHSTDIDIVNSVLDVIQQNFPMLEHSIWSTRELTKFFHHLPTRHATFLMVDRDAFESVAEVLQDTGLNVIVHPLGEVAKKFKLIAADTVIIRPRLASDHHEIRSPIEQVLVDLHYECQKLGLYDGQEVSRIVNNLGTAYRINIAALSRYAQRRKIDPQDILSSIL